MSGTPIRLNRRKFMGYSAAASWAALGTGAIASEAIPLRVGLVGVGTRGTALLRALLELEHVTVAHVADPVAKHRNRGRGIVEKSTEAPPRVSETADAVIRDDELDAVVIAVPNDLHADLACRALESRKHVYLEKPLGLSVAECDRVIEAGRSHIDRVVHVGFQRASHPRFLAGIDLVRRGELGPPIGGRVAWTSSNGPIRGHDDWLGSRERSGDWMLEQGVHIWQMYHRVVGDVPSHAFGSGDRGLFADAFPGRDVTDYFQAALHWPDGFALSVLQSWIAPPHPAFTGILMEVTGRDGGFDFQTGTVTYRDRDRPRETLHPGNLPDTRFALADFVAAIRDRSMAPVALEEAREATVTGLMVRKAVDERRVVTRDEILGAT